MREEIVNNFHEAIAKVETREISVYAPKEFEEWGVRGAVVIYLGLRSDWNMGLTAFNELAEFISILNPINITWETDDRGYTFETKDERIVKKMTRAINKHLEEK